MGMGMRVHTCVRLCVHLKVGVDEDARELCCSVALVCEGTQLSEDLLDQLYVVVPHCHQSGLFQTLWFLWDIKKTHTHLLFYLNTYLKY